MNGDLRRFVQVHYTLRDEDGDTDEFVRREILMAMRWQAPAFDKIDGRKGPENPAGVKTIHDLDQGAAVTAERLAAAVAMLGEAIDYYLSAPWEPFPGRNAEAVADLTTLAVTLLRALNPSRPIPEEATRP